MLAAKKAGFPIIMLHENDPAKHGCEFGVFFDGRTPPELLKEGIYTALALALYPGDFQATSFALAALVLGASESGVWSRFKARVIEKISRRKWIFFPKKDNVAPKESTPLDLTVNALQAAKRGKAARLCVSAPRRTPAPARRMCCRRPTPLLPVRQQLRSRPSSSSRPARPSRQSRRRAPARTSRPPSAVAQ